MSDFGQTVSSLIISSIKMDGRLFILKFPQLRTTSSPFLVVVCENFALTPQTSCLSSRVKFPHGQRHRTLWTIFCLLCLCIKLLSFPSPHAPCLLTTTCTNARENIYTFWQQCIEMRWKSGPCHKPHWNKPKYTDHRSQWH